MVRFQDARVDPNPFNAYVTSPAGVIAQADAQPENQPASQSASQPTTQPQSAPQIPTPRRCESFGVQPPQVAVENDRFNAHMNNPAPWCRVISIIFPLVNFTIFAAILALKGAVGPPDVFHLLPFILFALVCLGIHCMIFLCSLAGVESSISRVLAPYWNKRSHILGLFTFAFVWVMIDLQLSLHLGKDFSMSANQALTFCLSVATILLITLIFLLPLPCERDYLLLVVDMESAVIRWTSRHFSSTFICRCGDVENLAEVPFLDEEEGVPGEDDFDTAPTGSEGSSLDDGALSPNPSSASAPSSAPGDAPASWCQCQWFSCCSWCPSSMSKKCAEALHYAAVGAIVSMFIAAFACNVDAHDGLTISAFLLTILFFIAFFFAKRAAKREKMTQRATLTILNADGVEILNPALRFWNSLSLNCEVSAFTYMALCLIVINVED